MTIELKDICKSFGRQVVLDHVSLTLHEGEIVALLGPNGAGKSTLMKVLLGLWKADSGEVNAGVRHGYLPEQNPLYEEMYVREYIAFMQQISGSREDTEALIARVGLTREAHKKIGELSKGYRQRVGLAQALIGNPELLVLDEPTTGLDPNQLDEIREVIREAGKDRTVILSTHILDEVRKMCTRVVMISHGQIVLDKPIGEVENVEEMFREKCR